MKFTDDTALYKTIGDNIKLHREKSGMTQTVLAEKANISLSYLSKVEATGCNKSVSLSALNQIANALDVDIINFFKRTCR